MDLAEIVTYAMRQIEPTPDLAGVPAFRCAAHLKDGLYLPCVLLRATNPQIDLALRRFAETAVQEERTEQERKTFLRRLFATAVPFGLTDIVKTFVATGNRVNSWHLDRIESSPFALPLARLQEIQGETRMGWTQFVGVMRDGKQFSFGTTYHTQFFEMPPSYTATDVVRIIPGEAVAGPTYRERPFFECFIDGA
jgi:hypothetical protein